MQRYFFCFVIFVGLNLMLFAIIEVELRISLPNPTFTNTLLERCEKEQADRRLAPFPFASTNLSCHCATANYVFVVHSAAGNFERRSAVRQTYASKMQQRTYSFCTYFLLGLPMNESIQANIEDESRFHLDIIQSEFVEDYQNLTIKVCNSNPNLFQFLHTLAMLRFARDYCPSRRAVFKIDDDMVLHPMNIFKQDNFTNFAIYGTIGLDKPVVRDAQSKWYMSNVSYANETYPPYAFGSAYVVNTKAIEPLIEAAESSCEYTHIEDIFITGFIASRAGVPLEEPLNWLILDQPSALAEFERGGARVGYAEDHYGMLQIWNRSSFVMKINEIKQ